MYMGITGETQSEPGANTSQPRSQNGAAPLNPTSPGCDPLRYVRELERSCFCAPCAAGKFSTTVGSDHASDCNACPVGTYLPPSAGYMHGNKTWQNETLWRGHTSASVSNWTVGLGYLGDAGTWCVRCPAGKWTDATGSDSADDCASCPKSTYNALSGRISQSEHLASQSSTLLAAGVRLRHCAPCPNGKYTTFLGAESVEQCINCPSGKWRTAFASAADLGSAACSDCPPHSYSSREASDHPSDCETSAPSGTRFA